jgi:hypothetical protein
VVVVVVGGGGGVPTTQSLGAPAAIQPSMASRKMGSTAPCGGITSPRGPAPFMRCSSTELSGRPGATSTPPSADGMFTVAVHGSVDRSRPALGTVSEWQPVVHAIS